MKIETLYEDEQFIIVNKPSGVLAIADRHNPLLFSVAKYLQQKMADVFIVHRIDKDTSGCICFAKTVEAHKYLSGLFEHRTVEKIYLGIVQGSFDLAEGQLNEPIMEHPTIKGKMVINAKHGKPSITAYRTIESFGLYSLVEFKILTGRTHQIRLHSQNAGHAIVCDPLYGLTNPVYISSFKKRYKMAKNELDERPVLNRLALHASKLEFFNDSGVKVSAEAPLPRDMNAMLNQCRKWLK